MTKGRTVNTVITLVVCAALVVLAFICGHDFGAVDVGSKGRSAEITDMASMGAMLDDIVPLITGGASSVDGDGERRYSSATINEVTSLCVNSEDERFV